MIVLDTNVLSEMMRPRPAVEVLRWTGRYPRSQFLTTAITQAEILYGIELLPRGRRRTALEAAASAMFEEDFAGRIVPFDGDAARAFAHIAARRRKLGRPIAQWDAQIAAIVRSLGAALATRNTDDFQHCGIEVVNPWTAK